MDGREWNPDPGSVRFLDHTADVGFEAEAATLPALFVEAAHALNALILGLEEAGGGELSHTTHAAVTENAGRAVDLRMEAEDAPALMAEWLRELIYRFETEGVILREVTFRRLDERTLQAQVSLSKPATQPVREIKGVTYHGLEVRRSDTGRWRARVILDV